MTLNRINILTQSHVLVMVAGITMTWGVVAILNGCVDVAGKSLDDKAPATASDELHIEKSTSIHRLASTQRSPFDAFVYVNRIPEKLDNGEYPEDLSGRIMSRLANQEGRILVKLPKGMDRDAYEGFKMFTRTEGPGRVGNCAACHTFPDFTDSLSHVVTPGGSPAPTPSLRNKAYESLTLIDILLRKIQAAHQKQSGKFEGVDNAYSAIKFSKDALPQLIAFLNTLQDVTDAEFRELILNSTVLDTSENIE